MPFQRRYRRGRRPAAPRPAEIRIEFPSRGATYYHEKYGVYSYDEYPDHSVLAGQERRSFLDSFDTLEEARAAYPNATGPESPGYHPPYLGHLPDDGDY